MDRFTRARLVSINAGESYSLTYTIPADTELLITELFSSSTKPVIIELQFSDDGGSTWSNPWDDQSEHLLWLLLAAGIPAEGRPSNTWFQGDGTNTIVRIKITNTDPDNAASVFYLIKGLEKDLGA